MSSASTIPASGGATPRILPVFFKNSDVIEGEGSTELSVYEVCFAAERISGHSSIDGTQRIKDLWRI